MLIKMEWLRGERGGCWNYIPRLRLARQQGEKVWALFLWNLVPCLTPWSCCINGKFSYQAEPKREGEINSHFPIGASTAQKPLPLYLYAG